jgi:hypothetical protein
VLNCSVLGSGLDGIVIIGGFALSFGTAYLDMVRELMTVGCDYPVLSRFLPGMVHLGDVTEEACLVGAAAYARRIAHGKP